MQHLKLSYFSTLADKNLFIVEPCSIGWDDLEKSFTRDWKKQTNIADLLSKYARQLSAFIP